MTGRWNRDKIVTSKIYAFSILQCTVGIGIGGLADDTESTRQQLFQVARSGDVIGMTMSVQCKLELET